MTSTRLPSLAETDTYVFWSHNEGPGWTYVLPPLADQRVLCVDAAGGAVAWALARESARVTLLSAGETWPSPDRGTGQLAAGFPHVELDELLAAMDGEPFDALVIHDPLGTRLHREGMKPLKRLLGAAAALLRPEGWIYLAAGNPLSPQRLRARMRGTSSHCGEPPARRTLERLLREAGMPVIRVYPYLLANGRVAEVVAPGGYRATKNRESVAERLKERLLGPWGAPRFAPALGLLARRDPHAATVLDELVRKVGTLRSDQRSAVLKQYLVFSGHKAIISAGPEGRNDQDAIAVLTADAVSTRGRALEAPHLEALSQIKALAPFVPKLLDRFQWGHAQCVAMERVPGVTLDHDLPVLERVTDSALEFLVHLHRETAVPARPNTAAFDQLVQPLLDAVSERNPDYAAAVNEWASPLRIALLGTPWPAVFQHGDFKVENVIYEPGSCRIMSVIDWELARRPGLPVLDALYLLLYNRIIRGARWYEALEQLIVRNEFTPSENNRLSRYLTALNIDARLMPAFRVAFMAHHLGCRIHLPADSPLRAKIGEMFTELGRIIGRAHSNRCPDSSR